MKLKALLTKFLTNKWVLKIVSLLAFLNIIGYIVMGNINSLVFFIILAVLIRYFSKNMIIILGVPLIIVNLISLKRGQVYEGMENKEEEKTNEKIIEKEINKQNSENTITLPNGTISTGKVEQSGFEVGRRKNGGAKIDYATTIEESYDELNKILGSDGIKNLTNDTQRLIQQQSELAKSMESMTPLIEGIMPIAQQAQDMMKNLDDKNNGLGSVMELAKKMSGAGSLNK